MTVLNCVSRLVVDVRTFFEAYNGAVTAVATIFIAIFTVVLALVTNRQARLTRESLKIAQQAMVTGNRAYISIRSVFFGSNLRDGELQGINTGFTLENTGNTPTKYMISHSSMRIFTGDILANFEFPDLDERQGVRIFIAPKQWVGSFVFNVTREELLSCVGGHRRIFIWGWADYNDAFPNTPRHRTEFCYDITVAKDPSVGPIGQSLSASQYRRHNAADDECDRRPKPYSAP
jgi:hypothetical protein